MKILVIGGGAAGMAAAITAARHGAEVTVLEAEKSCCRKIRRSGNGHCNFAPSRIREDAYHGSFSGCAEQLLAEGLDGLLAFFASCGILSRTVKEGYYPASEEADSVYKALLYTASSAGVTVRNGQKAVYASHNAEGFHVVTEDWEYGADRVILCTGSNAGLPEESARGYTLARSFGHSVTPLLPALTGLVGEEQPYSWSGVRARAAVSLFAGEKEICASSGQIQFTDYGISGIPVFDLSGAAARCMSMGEDTEIRIDLFPDRTAEELAEFLSQKAKDGYEGSILGGIVPSKLHGSFPEGHEITIPDSIRPADPDGQAGKWYSLAVSVKNLCLRPVRTRGLREAQVCAGGIPLSEIDPCTFGSRIVPGLYLCGELLDADGICGGYNLAFAFLGGIRAGTSAAQDQRP